MDAWKRRYTILIIKIQNNFPRVMRRAPRGREKIIIGENGEKDIFLLNLL